MDDMKLQSVGNVTSALKAIKENTDQKTPESTSFGQWLNQSLKSVNQLRTDADTSVLKLATGENKDIHGTMIKMQKAEITTNLMIEIRNKVISAYDEIKRMSF